MHTIMASKTYAVNMTARAPNCSMPEADLNELYERPGFLFRRAHQIAAGIFVQEAGELGLTPPQHSALYAIGRRPRLDQTALARALGFDRATMGTVIGGLEARGLLQREPGADRRRKALLLTPAGRKMLEQAMPAARRTTQRLMSPLSATERQVFALLLTRITHELNSQSRTPVET
jgi:MarR family transcriptional regulator, lower aerobic nicotinate degradation pathway regulator